MASARTVSNGFPESWRRQLCVFAVGPMPYRGTTDDIVKISRPAPAAGASPDGTIPEHWAVQVFDVTADALSFFPVICASPKATAGVAERDPTPTAGGASFAPPDPPVRRSRR